MEDKILIIGSEGFIGKAFIDHYITKTNFMENLFMVDIQKIKKNNYYKCNASNFENINKIIEKIKPDQIYNFSGTFSNIYEIDYVNNAIVSKNIFDSILQNNYLNCKILINGSAAEYGYIKDYNQPVAEDYALNPISFYGLSKCCQTQLAKTYYFKNEIKVYIARPFNIIGYGISNKLFIGNLIDQIKLNLEKNEKIKIGNLNNERDYLDIEDLIGAYEKILSHGNPGDIYNIGSGKSIKIRNLLRLFLDIFEIGEKEVEVSKDFIKKFDVQKIVADISKLENLNWNPKISLEDSVLRIKKTLLEKI